MPDGFEVECYAKNIAERVAKRIYPDGFAPLTIKEDRVIKAYWSELQELNKWRTRKPSEVFVGSMADTFGPWVPDEYVGMILDMARLTKQNLYFFLTKNPVRYLEWEGKLGPNMLMGASMPPSSMNGQSLDEKAQRRMLEKSLNILASLKARTWMSFEPLSWDVAAFLKTLDVDLVRAALDWAVIGAASNGTHYYQPEEDWLFDLTRYLQDLGVPIFLKGNIQYVRRVGWFEEKPPGLAPADHRHHLGAVTWV